MYIATIKQRQQAAWASGDYAAAGTRLLLTAELLRVCRPGGRIGMVNWVPDGYVGELFRAIGRYLPPPPGVRPPVLWGTEQRLRELFGPEADISAPRRTFRWRFPSAEHQVEFFATFYGPTTKALAALEADRAAGLKADMLEAARRFDVSDDDTMVLQMDYLEAIIKKPATPSPTASSRRLRRGGVASEVPPGGRARSITPQGQRAAAWPVHRRTSPAPANLLAQPAPSREQSAPGAVAGHARRAPATRRRPAAVRPA